MNRRRERLLGSGIDIRGYGKGIAVEDWPHMWVEARSYATQALIPVGRRVADLGYMLPVAHWGTYDERGVSRRSVVFS
ncbi:MAG: hypothetical protein E6Q97_12400 [Desulfurellales bacterium]|nr:MAG: hypothetical protein E6Q97_12400 [Desulfurellales bacterium]